MWREKKETDVHQEADRERPWRERERDSARVLASDCFQFSCSDPSTVVRVTGLQVIEQKPRMKNCLLQLFPEKSYGPGSP